MNIFKKPLAGIAVILALIVSGGAQAAVGYCVAPNQTTNSLSILDAKFTIGATTYTPTDCYGITDTGSSNVANNLTFVNGLRWQPFLGGVKDDIGGGNNSTTVNSILYTLTTGAISGSGLNTIQSWTFSWSDTNGATDPNLPVLVDFALQWNGGNKDVFYLFEDVLLPVSPTSGFGTIDIKVTNPPGNNDIGTSHVSLFLSGESSPTRLQVDLPEPATPFLIAMGALGLAITRRRKMRV